MDPGRPAAEREERVLAVDFGTRRIGLAVGHLSVSQVVPLETVHRAPEDPEPELRVAGVAREEGVSRILVGLPLNMDGSEGSSARRARAFGRSLEKASGLPVIYVDERLTSEAALERARQSGRKRGGRAIDDLAAVILAESWLADEAARRARLRWNDPESPS